MTLNLRRHLFSRTAIIGGGAILFVLLVLILVPFLIEGPLRSHMEKQINRSLTGYSVNLQELDFHLIGFSITLKDLVLRQNAHPNPPVVSFPLLYAQVHWRALLSGRLVAEFYLEKPHIIINLKQLRAEAKSKVPIKERGWQEAALAIYPLKINQLKIKDGDLVYNDEDPDRPLHLDQIKLEAENIRNIKSPERSYPSPFNFQARVFENGRAIMKGNADFLAEPHFAVDVDLEVHKITLNYFRPVLSRYNMYIGEGVFSASGKMEYAPEIQIARLRNLEADNLELDYIHYAETEQKERERVKKAAEVTQEVSNKPGLLLRVDNLQLKGQLGMVNKATNPSYRVFCNSMNLHLTNFSNHFRNGEAQARLQGNFMGSGRTLATATFRPEKNGPDFDLNVKIEDTRLKSMNNLLRAYGDFDVAGGSFSLYSEISVKNDNIEGYLKPLFKDMNVYDRRQDKEKDIFSKIYEGLIGGIANLLKNEPREEVATRADLSGKVENPETSTWQIIIKLVQNAFFKSILPGFEHEVSPDNDDSEDRQKN